jgi:hydroxymethylbilane synthase
MLPAVGQGALCIEIREDDRNIRNLIRSLIDYNSMYEIKAERALLARLQGGCQIPIGAHAEVIYPSNLKMEAVVCTLDGTTVIRDTVDGKVDDFSTMGIELANKLLGRGGYKILEDIRANLGQE